VFSALFYTNPTINWPEFLFHLCIRYCCEYKRSNGKCRAAWR